jgi:hypothetical protein
MTHKYRGLRYQIVIWGVTTLRYKVFERGLKNRLKLWKAAYYFGERIEANQDECEENFVVRAHQAVHSYIDEQANEYDRMKTLDKVCKDKSIEFLSRISK